MRSLALPHLLGFWPHHFKPDTTTWPPARVLVGAGDIAYCGLAGDEATAALLDRIPGIVFAIGDDAYPDGSPADFQECYAPTWGRHRARTHPTPGNHEYRGDRADGYFAYFGELAGPAGLGYYSYDVAGWHVVALNSNIDMRRGSPQWHWLRADLAAHPRRCTLAYLHHPLWTSSDDSVAAVRPLYESLYAARADVVLAAHHHSYERFAPMSPWGDPDGAHGLREFVVGTGGAALEPFGRTRRHSERRYSRNYGVIRILLERDGYRWQFITAGGRIRDSGRGRCH
jgi:acid phosphatase type 7